MKTVLPQEKIQLFWDILEPLLPHAMPKLLHPSPSPPLLQKIDSWCATLGTPEKQDTYDTIRAALLILADDLSPAHSLVQNLHSPLAAAWHAVIHRREADFWNSNYWWRRAASLPWENLGQQVSTLLAPFQHELPALCTPTYSPSAFTDAVERHHDSPHLVPTLLEVQRLEWKSLLLATLHDSSAP
ncbi:MAG: hypothetical protein ACTHN5_24085 [Phycisphaerae bacterium]